VRKGYGDEEKREECEVGEVRELAGNAAGACCGRP